jgi:RND family efflux transporter MFP subunit
VRAGAVLAELAPTEIAAEVEKAHQARAKAERDLTRARLLYRDSVATLEQMQDAATAFEVAESNVRIAEFNRQYAVVRAPADGIVLTRDVEPGQLVAPGALVVRFRTDRRGLVMRGGLPDRDAVKLRTGDVATVQLDALPAERFRGRVTQIAMGATPGTGTYEVEVAIAAGGRVLASGLVGQVELVPRSLGRVPTVPVTAILEAHGDSATVFTLSADRTKAVRRRVQVGVLDGDRVTVLGGLERGAAVVTDGAAWLADGAPVKLSAKPSESPAGKAP